MSGKSNLLGVSYLHKRLFRKNGTLDGRQFGLLVLRGWCRMRFRLSAPTPAVPGEGSDMGSPECPLGASATRAPGAPFPARMSHAAGATLAAVTGARRRAPARTAHARSSRPSG